ncbi:MAG: HEAT repeat domain-containing protein [Spirochaetes bacterium]|nr:HEAT repeat domain-containing protein [Spirochaetota bacterium]
MSLRHAIMPAALVAAITIIFTAGNVPSASVLVAAERAPSGEISRFIRALADEPEEAKRDGILARLQEYPADEVASRWLDYMNGTGWSKKKARIIDSMGEFNHRSFVLPLANLLVSPNSEIRRSSARALKKIGDDRLYPIILRMVNSDVPVHKIYFIEAMNHLFDHRFYPSLTGLLRDGNKSIRIYVINCLRENRILESLGLIRSTAQSDRNDEVRIVAIEALGALRDGNSLGVLHSILNDRSRDVRRESARSLRILGYAASVNPVSSRLNHEEDDGIKEILLDTLANMKRIGDIRGAERILLHDDNTELRIKAAHVIGFSPSLGAMAALRRALPDPDRLVRAEACNSLGNYRNRQALEGLLDVLGGTDSVYVRSAALHSIRRINDKSSLLALFDLHVREKNPIMKALMREAIRDFIRRFV